MRLVAALLAAALAATALPACGDGGAEPGAPEGASLVLDFTPNAAHAGIYSALERGFYRDAGVQLSVREPGQGTDAPRLLEAGRAEFAILDIADLGIARESGFDVVGLMPIVAAPLASVIARADGPVRRPRDLAGRVAGVAGLPSDEAVLDSIVAADGGEPGEVERVTVGFGAVAALAAGSLDAATGFRNAEAVALRRRGVPVRVFRVDSFGAPRYPELVLATSAKTLARRPALVRAVVAATSRGYRFLLAHPRVGLAYLVGAATGLDRAEQAAQLRVLIPAFRPVGRLQPSTTGAWAEWALAKGILEQPLDTDAAFSPQLP